MSKLKAITPKKVKPSKPKILIYGKPGVGKTWASLDFPKVYYIDTEGGATRDNYTAKLNKSSGAYFGIEQGSLDFKEVIEQVKALATEQHDYQTLVIDSFSKLYLTAASEAAEDGGDDFGRDKKEANKPTKMLINWIDKLDMNIILVAHEKPEWGIDAKGNRSEIGRTFDGYDKLSYELDLCLNIIKQGNSRIARVNKSRLEEFPDASTFVWSYEEFAKRYGIEVIELKSVPIDLATEAQIKEIETLLEVVKMVDGFLDKCKKKARVNSLTELNKDQADKIINAIKIKKGE